MEDFQKIVLQGAEKGGNNFWVIHMGRQLVVEAFEEIPIEDENAICCQLLVEIEDLMAGIGKMLNDIKTEEGVKGLIWLDFTPTFDLMF